VEEKIQAALKKGPHTNKQLRSELGLRKDYDSRLDRALQKLRKEGKIKVDKGRWMGSSTQVCPHCAGKGWVNK
jgi:hypothetical protein